MDAKTDQLALAMANLKTMEDVGEISTSIRDQILPQMNELRAVADEAETLTAEKYWPFPRYGQLLFGVG